MTVSASVADFVAGQRELLLRLEKFAATQVVGVCDHHGEYC